MLDDIDEGARVGVWTAIGIIALLLFGLLGGLILHQMHHQTGASVAASAEPVTTSEETLIDGPITGDLLATVYFALGQSSLPAEAIGELDKVKQAMAVAPNRKLVLSGFHDTSGDPAKNAELAKQRAKNVRAALVDMGVPSDHIGLRKPESTVGDGSAQEARRVELRLVD